MTSARTGREILFVLSLVFVVGLASRAPTSEPAGQSARPNTWSARSSTGLTLIGTWTAVVDPATGNVSGTWTLINAEGKTLTRGGWSAAKSRTGWSGAWRATMSDRAAEYSGTWSAGAGLKANAPFGDLFEEAVRSIVSGSWRAGGQSGTWSIRAFN